MEAINPGFDVTQIRPTISGNVRAMQGHLGGELIAPELMNHVAIPLERNSLVWKILKRITNLVRHRVLADREIDGAVH